jgi:uncharacterized protein (DUF488 family)
MNATPGAADRTVFTIGHSNHDLEELLSLLQEHSIQVIVDVRSAPYSRFAPQYNRESLERSLSARGIQYLFLGRELGARPSDPECYDQDRVQYERIARSPAFLEGIRRVEEGAAGRRSALMCTEKDPLDCHRAILVAEALVKRQIPVNHIHADGSVETHEIARRRLLNVTGTPAQDLFMNEDELIREALSRQETRIAFRRSQTSSD